LTEAVFVIFVMFGDESVFSENLFHVIFDLVIGLLMDLRY